MNRVRSALFLFILAISALAPAEDVKKQLAANYAAVNKAFQKRDVDAFARMISPNYASKASNGKIIDRAKLVGDFKKQMALVKSGTWQRSLKSAKVKGSVAVAVVDGSFKGTMTGPDGKDHKVESISTAEDTWTKGKRGWLLQNKKILKRSLKVDGKLIGG